MHKAELDQRLETALRQAQPMEAAYRLAVSLKSEGLTQEQVHSVFDAARVRHEPDDDEKYDAVLDVMDFIVGWCSPGRRLFPPAESSAEEGV